MGAKFIFVLGGVLSGLGKGIVASSIAKLLQDAGYKVNIAKVDPYINIDAGTMRPTEHGEVWVTDDGGEIDQDLGNYERFLNRDIPKKNNITTGQIYLDVINRERRLEYEGKNVEVIPDVVNEVKRRFRLIEEDNDFAIIEIGGTTGDIQNLIFLHAAREIGRESPTAYILVTYMPFLKNVGEPKSKPTQHAAALLREVGIMPDFIVTRGEYQLDGPRKDKIARLCFIDPSSIIDDPDMNSIYEVPLLFMEQKLGEKLLSKFKMPPKEGDMKNWKAILEKMKNADKVVKVGVIGKYVSYGISEHKDVYLSVLESVKHACSHLGVKAIIEQVQSTDIEEKGLDLLKKYDGIIVPGGFGCSGVEGKIETIKHCRENNVPFLGLCFGFQMAVIEFARNVCGMNGANSTEINPETPCPVIDLLPEQKELIKLKQYGATMRLGAYPAILKAGSKVKEIYGKEFISERHRHRYEVNPDFIGTLEEKGLIFSGQSPDRRLMEFLEMPGHRFFIATQAHPEFKSRFESPAPLFTAFVKACLEAPVQKTLDKK